jgi:hypothetical protein
MRTGWIAADLRRDDDGRRRMRPRESRRGERMVWDEPPSRSIGKCRTLKWFIPLPALWLLGGCVLDSPVWWAVNGAREIVPSAVRLVTDEPLVTTSQPQETKSDGLVTEATPDVIKPTEDYDPLHP